LHQEGRSEGSEGSESCEALEDPNGWTADLVAVGGRGRALSVWLTMYPYLF